MPDVDLKLPRLKGNDIEEHFLNIAKDQVAPYQKLIASVVAAEIPEMPKVRFFKQNSLL
jgi:DNA polymerase gamma 1